LSIRRKLGWGERRVLLTVGRLQKRKGHDHMILALRQIRKAIPDVLYAIVGEGEEGEYLRNLAEREGVKEHVQFLGEVDDGALIECYQQCDLFALPNRQVGRDIEGFGMVLLEAQACGKPVLAGASGGTAETMHVPTTGQVVCCDAPEPLAAAVSELLADRELLAQMAAVGRRAVRLGRPERARRAGVSARSGCPVILPVGTGTRMKGTLKLVTCSSRLTSNGLVPGSAPRCLNQRAAGPPTDHRWRTPPPVTRNRFQSHRQGALPACHRKLTPVAARL
jgi:hypothetical protein